MSDGDGGNEKLWLERSRANADAFAAAEAEMLAHAFVPCAVYFPDSDATEVVLSDAVFVWRQHGTIELGYCMETGALVGVRIPGDVTKR